MLNHKIECVYNYAPPPPFYILKGAGLSSSSLSSHSLPCVRMRRRAMMISHSSEAHGTSIIAAQVVTWSQQVNRAALKYLAATTSEGRKLQARLHIWKLIIRAQVRQPGAIDILVGERDRRQVSTDLRVSMLSTTGFQTLQDISMSHYISTWLDLLSEQLAVIAPALKHGTLDSLQLPMATIALLYSNSNENVFIHTHTAITAPKHMPSTLVLWIFPSLVALLA